MRSRGHAVLLGGEQVGTLLHVGDVARFVFDDDYWHREDRNVLGLWFEDNPRSSPRSALRLPTWFSNLLPEGILREWIARDRRVSADREIELLLRVGHDLSGAVEVVEDGASGDWSLSVDEVAQVRQDFAETPWKFSLAGVGLKFSLLRDGDRLTIPSSGALGDWIVKLPDSSYPHVPLNEHAMMSLARSIGITVPDTLLVDRTNLPLLPDAVWPSNETTAYAVSRFDRSDGSRVHIEDFAQIRGFYPQAKYEGSFETVGAIAFRGTDEVSLQEFVRRVVFNVCIGNGDAHLKNWSMIYPDGRIPQLSPVYDLVSTAPYLGGVEREDLGLKLGGSRRFQSVGWRDFERLGRKLGAEHLDLAGLVEDTVLRLVGAMEDAVFDPRIEFVREWIEKELPNRERSLLR